MWAEGCEEHVTLDPPPQPAHIHLTHFLISRKHCVTFDFETENKVFSLSLSIWFVSWHNRSLACKSTAMHARVWLSLITDVCRQPWYYKTEVVLEVVVPPLPIKISTLQGCRTCAPKSLQKYNGRQSLQLSTPAPVESSWNLAWGRDTLSLFDCGLKSFLLDKASRGLPLPRDFPWRTKLLSPSLPLLLFTFTPRH